MRQRLDYEDFWVIVVVALSAFLFGVVLAATHAYAHDGDQPLAQWYRSLQAPTGESCCNMKDCQPVDARINGDHWEAKVQGTWQQIPDNIILKRDNLEGRAVLCIYGGSMRCFVPPAET